MNPVGPADRRGRVWAAAGSQSGRISPCLCPCAMLIQFKANHDVGDQHIKDFVAATEADMRANKPCAAILDLRYDDGGNYQNTAGFAEDLPNLTTPGGESIY